MIEKPAGNVKGSLLYDHDAEKYFFRVVNRNNPETGEYEYTDYILAAQDIEITIDRSFTNYVSLWEDPENPENNKLDWASNF